MDNKPKFDTLAPFEKWLEQNNYYVSGSWERFVNSDIDPKSYLGGLYLFWLKEQERQRATVECQGETVSKSIELPATKPKFEIPPRYELFRKWLQDKGILQDFSEYSWQKFINGSASCYAELNCQYQTWLREQKGDFSHDITRPRKIYDANKAIAIYNKMIDKERSEMQYATTLAQREQILNNIYRIIQERAYPINEIREKEAALHIERQKAEYEFQQQLREKEKSKWYYPILNNAAPVLSIVISLCLISVSLFFIHCIFVDSARWFCAFLLLLYSGLLMAISDFASGSNYDISDACQILTRNSLIVTAIAGFIVVLLTPLGYIWYYVCGGFLLFPDGAGLYEPDVWDYIFTLPLSIGLLIYLVFGFIGLFKR